jgi:peptidyl-prolyl cis-trans isomerase C
MRTMRSPVRPLFLIFFLGLLGCSPPGPKEVLARVAGEPILVADLLQAYYREGDKFGPDAAKDKKRFLAVKETLLEDLIQKKILTKEAVKEGIAVSEEDLEHEIRVYKSRYTERDFQKVLEERKIDYAIWREVKRTNLMTDRLLEKKLFGDLKIPEEEIKKYYEEHQEQFTQPESVRVRQILTDTKEKADSIHEKLEKGENFARLARALSIAPDRKQGGDLGFITRGSFPKEFEICFDLKVGELSPVVSSLYGFHIFKVVEKRSEIKLPLEEVRDQIEEWLKEQAREAAFQSYYEGLKKNYPVEIQQRVLKRVEVEG